MTPGPARDALFRLLPGHADRIRLTPLPDGGPGRFRVTGSGGRVEIAATGPHQFVLNDTHDGCTGPYADWPRWERLLDVLALHWTCGRTSRSSARRTGRGPCGRARW
ncbi:hypothetical protein [Streptomyces sp. NPDC059994]|uniref:hypothetical protein n=1 Tax=Streptomyces sp. NPDC059994 TaxID=3347029 RepID=UPI0036B4B737